MTTAIILAAALLGAIGGWAARSMRDNADVRALAEIATLRQKVADLHAYAESLRKDRGYTDGYHAPGRTR